MEAKRKNHQFGSDKSPKGALNDSLIFLAVAGGSVNEATRGTFSLSQLEDIVKKFAVHWGAGDHLFALLLSKLPPMLKELQLLPVADKGSKTFSPAKTQYRIWTKGECNIVEDISRYEADKKRFDFWIDRDEKQHQSFKNPLASIGPKAVNLLIYLVERLGTRVSKEQLLTDVWGEDAAQDIDCKKSQKNKIQQQFTKLEQFSGGRFLPHMFGQKLKKGIGLQRSFEDSYFIFERLA